MGNIVFMEGGKPLLQSILMTIYSIWISSCQVQFYRLESGRVLRIK